MQLDYIGFIDGEFIGFSYVHPREYRSDLYNKSATIADFEKAVFFQENAYINIRKINWAKEADLANSFIPKQMKIIHN